MYDPAWTDYVLRQLEEYEMFNGNPTCSGLRRITPKLLGPIIESVPIPVQAPNLQNDYHAVIGWRLSIRWGDDPDDIRVFGDIADVYIGNTVEAYTIYASATAATRAEGRSLRKALNLQRVLAAEEVGAVEMDDRKITKGQIEHINLLCSRHDISVVKLLQYGNQTRKYAKSIQDMPHALGVQMGKFLNEVQVNKRQIPDELLGYDQNWRK
jgi:hypothetical protein